MLKEMKKYVKFVHEYSSANKQELNYSHGISVFFFVCFFVEGLSKENKSVN